MALDTKHRPIMWSTLEEYEGAEDVLARSGPAEWNTKPAGYAEDFDSLNPAEKKVRRRTFLKLSGFAAVVAAAAGCQRPLENIMPYVNAPEELVPGVADFYASSLGAYGFIVKCREGRPIKLEGNPRHPLNKGKLSARLQASLIELYDPDRITSSIRKDGSSVAWDSAWTEISDALGKAGSKAVLLTPTVHGVARTALLDEFKKTFPGVRHVTFEAMSEAERLDAREMCYGERVQPQYRFEKSECTVLLGADPMADGVASISDMAGMADQRRLHEVGEGKYAMGRLYSFEPLMTQSGMNADYRFSVKAGEMLDLARAIAARLAMDGHSEVKGVPSNLANPTSIESSLGLPDGTVKKVADDLWRHRGKSLVYTGGLVSRTEDLAKLHATVNLINSMLGNEGVTIDVSRPLNLQQGSSEDMLDLIDDMKSGNVDVLLIEGVNPAYSLPTSAGFADALGNVGLSVSFDMIKSETSVLCDMTLPGKHYLENWGDHEPVQGTLTLQQPVMGPLKGWHNKSFEESLLGICRAGGSGAFEVEVVTPALGEDEEPTVSYRAMTWHEFIKNTWERDVYGKGDFAGSFQDFWFSALRSGVLDLPSRVTAGSGSRNINVDAVTDFIRGSARNVAGLELVTYTMSNVYDGRHANNPWLLELPDPVTRVCWDNFVVMAPQTARENKLEDGDIIAVTANDVTIEAPVRVMPGMHTGVLGIGAGWGREVAGSVGSGEGFNAYSAGRVVDGNVFYSGSECSFEKTGGHTRLADVQGHNYMKLRPEGSKREEDEPERQIVQSTSLELFNKSNIAAQPYYHVPYWHLGQEKPDAWKTKDFHYTGHKWVMSIDLNACNGCNACMVACQAENNVPVVGKREVLIGREMHWIRIDRYYKGDPDNPEVVKQPMLCQHCDNAPCETVCPVLATVHSDDGINQQVYNRCVGTRYCANNCPYKVRRYNFYQYSSFRRGPHEKEKVPETPLALALNPDITVRTKGIMEKCTFCQQRIRDERYDAKAKGQDIPDGAIQTACQQTCPASAISFGDANNPEHQVNEVREHNKDKRGYGVLAEYNVKPNVMYLAHVWNRETSEYDVDNTYYLEHQEHGLHGDHGDHGGEGGHGEGGGEHHNDSGHGGGHDSHAGEDEHHSFIPGTRTGVKS